MEFFSDSFVPAALGDLWFGTHHCPMCTATGLQYVRSDNTSHWRCLACGRCWQPEHGTLRQVDREVVTAAWQAPRPSA
jgi:hypothetical protein